MWKPLFGCSDLGDHLVVDGLIFDIPVKAFGGFKTLVEAIAESDVVSNVTINPWDMDNCGELGIHLIMTDRREVDQKHQRPRVRWPMGDP